MVSLTDGFIGVTRISAPRWGDAMMHAAPDVGNERGYRDYYTALLPIGVDPLLVLAIFQHESQMGARGIATITHSWGNMRNPPVGPVPYHLYHDPVKGAYLSFANWLDGCMATAYHLTSPLYAGLTIEQAIHRWAPAGDGANDPAAYAAGVVDFMNQYADQGGTVAVPTSADIGFPVTVNLTGSRGPQRAFTDVEWFVVHDGEGSYAGVVATLSNNPNASAHAVIAHDGSLTYMVPIDYTAWHPGNDSVALASIGVEQEGFADGHDGGYTDAQYQSMAAFYRWCVAQGCPIPATYIGHDDKDGGPLPDHPGILGHMDVPDGSGGWGGFAHHTDPGPRYDWNKLLAAIGGQPQPPPAPPDSRLFPETGHAISGPFKGFWEQFNDDAKSLAIFGYPVTDVLPEQPHRCQYFQRWVMRDMGGYIAGDLVGAAAAKAAGHSGPGIP